MTTARTISLSQYRLAGEVAEYIRGCCEAGDMQALQLQKLARRFGCSESSLKAMFRQRFGVPVHSFALEQRVKHICTLLEETDHSIKEIAFSTGYSELSNFSRDFARATGMAPSVYRERRMQPLQPGENSYAVN